ncbi:hybrid sensor histidine kinase/response regulator, partial [Bacteroidota bacterium]
NKKYFIGELNGRLYQSGDFIGTIGVIRDITERKKIEADLNEAYLKATESERLKSAFLTNMSHEIRTPMNGILGFTNLLKENGLTGDEQKEYINIIQKSGERMLSTINDIMDISKIESGQVNISISEVNVNEQTESLYNFFKYEVERKGMKISLNNSLPTIDCVIKTDIEKFYSILTNLIKNAIKYSHKGSIEFGYDRIETIHELTLLQFYVKDTGIGIPKSRQHAIFERFVQADIEDKAVYEGSGLGLAISKAYVEMLGGDIWVESEDGVGSTFYFTIPYSIDKKEIIESKTEGEIEQKHEIKKLKILIAEDEEISYRHLSIILKNIAKEIFHARTGIETIEICRNNPDIDLILMDIKMPKLSGYEATRQIRELNKNIIIIAQTAYALEGDREKAIESGCDDYISKPIDKDELMMKIKKLIISQ